MPMNMLLRRMKLGGTTVRGFRSYYRDGCADAISHWRDVAERALAHSPR
jgi:hypothetical protein